MNKINISETQKSIMLCKIQFLQKQLQQSTRREETLQQINEQLRNAIPQLISDKSKIQEMRRNDSVLNETQLEMRERENEMEIDSLTVKLKQLTESNLQYQRELRRMQKNMNQHIESIQMSHQRTIKHYQNKLEHLQLKLQKYSDLQDQLAEIHIQNTQLKKKLKHSQNHPLNHSQINTSQIQLQSMIKNLNHNHKDTSFTLQDIENISFNNRIPTQSDCSSIKEMAMTRSRSGVSEIKKNVKNVISSLYCEECEQNYAPNQYYKHLEIHEEKRRLEEEKREIEKRLKSKEQRMRLEGELSKVTVALKHHEKRYCTSARNLLRF